MNTAPAAETRYEIMEGEDKGGFIPSGESEWTLEEAEARLHELRDQLPEVYRNAFICQVVTTRLTARNPEVNHELQTIPTAD
jgi:hypothetical protein